MELVVTEHNHCDLVEVTGRIDSNTSPQIKEVLNALMNDNHYNIIIDFKNVTYLSSSGILAFVSTQRKLKRQNKGEIVFTNVPDLVFSTFELAGFDTVFEFYNDIASAVGRF